MKTKLHWNLVPQQIALCKDITMRTRYRKSSLQTTPHSLRLQPRIHLRRVTSCHHLILPFKDRPIQNPYSQGDLAPGHILHLVCTQLRSRMDSPSGLAHRPDYLKCLRLGIYPHQPVGCPRSLSLTTTTVQTCDATFGKVSAVINDSDGQV